MATTAPQQLRDGSTPGLLSPLLACALILGTLLGGPAHAGMPAIAAALGASVPVAVEVPDGMRGAPFNHQRSLNVPQGFHVAVYARVPGARFMALTPEGDLLVSSPSTGTIFLLRSNPGGQPTVSPFATGLDGPQGLAFHAGGATTYLYVGERSRIERFVWHARGANPGPQQEIVANLPSGPGYAHVYKDLAFGPDGSLYVNLGSSCNACTGDGVATPARGTIYRYNADGSGGRLFARGLRNAEGLAFVPGTASLWAAVNERDEIAYPFKDTTGHYGKVVRSYVDNHPPDELTWVRPGANYGWPYCNPDPDTAAGLDQMPFDPDFQFNQRGGYSSHGAVADCSTMSRVSKGIQAHSAPLGMAFLQGTAFPAAFRPGLVLALHGSWDRSRKTGYKVVYFPWVSDSNGGHPGTQMDLVSGWLPQSSQTDWDRPVDVVVDADGALLISADASGTIYRLTYAA